MDIAAYAQAILERLDSPKSKPCGKSFIPTSKKCSPEKARTTSLHHNKESLSKFKQKQRKQNALRAEVKRSAGQKPREISEDVLRTREAFKQGIAKTKGKDLSPTYQEAVRRVEETGHVESFRQGTKDLLNQVRDEKAAKRAKSRPVGETFIKPKDSPKDLTKLSDKELHKAQLETSYFTPEGKRIHDEYQRRVAEHKAKNPGPNLFQQLEEGHKQRQKERVERFRNPDKKKSTSTMTILPGSGRRPSQAAIKTKKGTIRASIDSAHERGVMKALAFYAKAMGV